MDQKPEIVTRGKPVFPNGRGRWLILFMILVGLGVTIWAEALYDLSISVIQRHGSSHGLFVPFISGYLIWLRLDTIKSIKPHGALLPGSAILLSGSLLFYFSRGGSGFSLSVLSFLLVAGGLILVLFGRRVFKEVSFPLFFLAAMIPLPTAIYSQIAEWMRYAATWGAVTLIKPLGVPLYREGFDVYLTDIHLYVAHGCSGIRYLLSYLVFGLAYAFRYKQSNKVRLAVVLVAVPLAVAGSVLRLWIMFFSAHYIGPAMVEHRPHVFLSWSVFMVLLAAAIGMDRYLSRRKFKKLI
jgi:exosortase